MVFSFYPHASTMSYMWPWQLPPHGHPFPVDCNGTATCHAVHLIFLYFVFQVGFLRVTKWLNLLEVWQICESTAFSPSKGSTRFIADSRVHSFATGKVCRCWQVKQHPPPSMTTLLCLCHWILCLSHPCPWWLNTIQLGNTYSIVLVSELIFSFQWATS